MSALSAFTPPPVAQKEQELVEIQCAATSVLSERNVRCATASRAQRAPERRIAVWGAGRAVAAVPIVEECSTDERIGQVGVTHDSLGYNCGLCADCRYPSRPIIKGE